jgi:hypothetical protein
MVGKMEKLKEMNQIAIEVLETARLHSLKNTLSAKNNRKKNAALPVKESAAFLTV